MARCDAGRRERRPLQLKCQVVPRERCGGQRAGRPTEQQRKSERGKGGRKPSPDGAGGAEPRTTSQQRQFSLRAFFCCQKKAGSREAAVPGQRFHYPEHCPINRTPKRPKNRLVRHCGQNAHNSSKNMCNFLNKTPLRKGGFFGTIKLCKSVCLELCPEQDWGMCQMTQDLCGPDNRTAL